MNFIINSTLFQTAGAAVKRAADTLVKAAQGSAMFHYDEVEVNVSKSLTGGFKQELEIQEEILRKERELEIARSKLHIIRKERYRPDEEE